MKNLRRLIGIFSVWALVFTECVAASPITVEADHDQVVRPYSALPVRVVFTNSSEKDITLIDFPVSNLLRIEMRSSDHEIVYRGVVQVPRVLDERLIPPQTLQPGEERAFRSRVSCEWNENALGDPLFEERGTYEMRFLYPATFQLDGEEEFAWLTTPFAEMTVRSVGERHRDSFEAVRDLSHPSLLLEPREVGFVLESREQQQEWERELDAFLSDHARSPWASYGYFAQSIVYLYWNHEDELAQAGGGNEGDPADLRRAAELLEMAVEAADQFDIQHVQREALRQWQNVLHDLSEDDGKQAEEVRRRLKEVMAEEE